MNAASANGMRLKLRLGLGQVATFFLLMSIVLALSASSSASPRRFVTKPHEEPHRASHEDAAGIPSGVENFRRLYRDAGEDSPLPFVSSSLGSNMVLQRAPAAASLWGWTSTPETKVVVSIDGEPVASNTSASDDGFWVVTLAPFPASTTPHILNISSSEGESAVLENVLFGDVYLCGGQSNMEFTVSQAFNATQEIALANDYPNIRLFTVGQGNISSIPVPNLLSIEQEWSVASNNTVGGSGWTYFSAVCWFYVKNLYDATNVPIGAISNNWGGTIVQAWSSPDALAACSTNLSLSLESNSASNSKPRGDQLHSHELDLDASVNPNQNTVLWNAMIVPFLPMTLRGAIWYQGESNILQSEYYACAFPAMILDWRMKWGVVDPSDFGFFFVQLAAYTELAYENDLAATRLAQTAALALPYVGMATAVDLGDLSSPEGNIHPENKEAVGARLALNALYYLYDQKDVLFSGPVPTAGQLQQGSFGNGIVVLSQAPKLALEIPFSEALLILPNVTCPSSLGASNCTGFEIQTSDSFWHPASASISEDSPSSLVLVLQDSVSPLLTVWGVRYGYSNWPLISVYGVDSKLPVTPFYFQFQLQGNY